MSRSLHQPSKAAALMALAGFSLTSLRPRSARAQSIGTPSTGSTSDFGSTGDGTSDSTSDGTEDAVAGTVALTVIGAAVLLAGTIVLVVYLVKKGKRPTGSDDPEEADPSGVEVARALLDSGLMATRGELGLQVALMAQGPAAFDQVTDELTRGSGPAVDELVRTTGLPPDELKRMWDAARAANGAVTDAASATRVVADFLARVAPSIQQDPSLSSDLLWRLAVEWFGDDEAHPAHAWLARWLGVPVEAALNASGAAFSDLRGASDSVRRGRIQAGPDGYLDRLAKELNATHRMALERRARALIQNAGPWLPPHLVDEVPLVDE